MTTLKDKVKAKLIKGGCNPLDVNKMLAKNFSYATKTYPTANVSYLAKCLVSLQ